MMKCEIFQVMYLLSLQNNVGRIFSNAAAFLVTLCFSIGLILAILGIIQWATGWDERNGKKSIVRGVILIGVSLLVGGGILTGYLFT